MNFLPRLLLSTLLLLASLGPVMANNSVHVAYHWHLHQPIYWPEVNPNAPQNNRYQFAADSLNLKYANSGNFYAGSTFKHPRNALASGDGGEFDAVFDKADRVIAYQGGGRDSINTILSHPDGGASVSYSGALMENIWSLGNANMLGYGSGWNSGYTQARGSSATYRTSGGHPRADMVGQTYHHAFSPLLPKSVLRKEIQIFKEIWWKSWNGNPNKSDHSKGFWPVECAFSRHMIPILVEEGYQWSIVANSHLARTCTNYLDVAQRGNSGWNIDPPNRADQLGPYVPSNQWWSGTIDGRGGAFPAPYAYQAHLAKYVDPNTGVESKITIVPMCDLLSYQNGFSTMGTGDIDAHIAPFNNPGQPSITLMAHDGDNAWGGGNAYYMNSVSSLFNEAAGKGYRPTTIQQFLADHPVPAGDVVHIEDGAWVNAASDWGHPQFINWCWPPVRQSSDPAYNAQDPRTWFNITNGWAEDFRNWAVLIAGANYCETAEQITTSTGGSVQAYKIQEPVSRTGVNNNPNAAEQAWHYYLGGLDSGFMYYGTSLDDEVKQTLAANRAISLATPVIGNGALDQTPPTMFKPQRFPWNPGGMGWGPLTGYKEVGFNGKPAWPSDFYVWTHIFDVSGVSIVTLFVRSDADGMNPIADNANELYAGGAGVGSWVSIPMNKRVMPTANFYNDPQISFFMLPTAIADEYWAQVVGYTNVLLDYYVMSVDARGNTNQSDIQHVWVGAGDTSGGGGGGSSVVTVLPSPPVAGNSVTIQYNATGRSLAAANPVKIHLGWNNWASVVSPDLAMTFNSASNVWEFTTNVAVNATRLDVVFNNGSGTWDNNGGADWHIAVQPNSAPQPPATPTGLTATPVSSNQINLSWSSSAGATGYFVQRGGSNLTTTAAANYSDTGLAAGTTHCYSIVATNSLGDSAPTAAQCATTLAPSTNYPAFAMDGALDSTNCRVAASGMTIYAALRGTRLYLATWSPGNSGPNDHFIFVSDQLLATTNSPAPWAKAGRVAVATSKPFLAAESAGSYVGWFNAPSGSLAAKASSSSGALEGTIDLVAAFGSMPTNIYLCSAAYITADGGALGAQCPAGSGSDIETNEFFVIPTDALRDHNGDGVFDRTDPQLGFTLQNLSLSGSNAWLNWNAMPGRGYRVMAADSPAGPWTDIVASETNAGPLQLDLSYGDAFDPGATQRFYRVKLLP